MQVGKGRDLGLNQISLFEAKVANGNAEQSLSRDIYRLGRRFDFFRMLSCYYTTVGFYFSALVSCSKVLISGNIPRVMCVPASIKSLTLLQCLDRSKIFISENISNDSALCNLPLYFY